MDEHTIADLRPLSYPSHKGLSPRRRSYPTAALRIVAIALLAIIPLRASPSEFSRGGNIPFWIESTNSRQLDAQAGRIIKQQGADTIVIRAPGLPENPQPADTEFMSLLKRMAPEKNVLIYGVLGHYVDGSHDSSSMITGWLADSPDAQLASRTHQLDGKERTIYFGNVADSGYRATVMDNAMEVNDLYGTDGLAIDGASRSMRCRIWKLKRKCESGLPICELYKLGNDRMFGRLKSRLGNRKLVFNGIWNRCDGDPLEQEKLLEFVDGASVEYFGNITYDKKTDTFARSISPFLGVMDRLDPAKFLYVYGRGAVDYEDYAQDYLRQRYYYGAYLLAARSNTFFHYFSSYQIAPHKGRTGGLAYHADRFIDPGNPTGPRRRENNLHIRDFQKGKVIVNPSRHTAITYDLGNSAWYSPEGEQHTGITSIGPRRSMVLLEDSPPPLPEYYEIPLEILNQWPDAEWYNGHLQLYESGTVGNHDLLLDEMRSFTPYSTIELDATPLKNTSRLRLVAEIDDTEKENAFAVLCVEVEGQTGCPSEITAIRYRMPNSWGKWPAFNVPAIPRGRPARLVISGNDVSLPSRYTFRRWAHMRIEGPWLLRSVKLSDRT